MLTILVLHSQETVVQPLLLWPLLGGFSENTWENKLEVSATKTKFFYELESLDLLAEESISWV